MIDNDKILNSQQYNLRKNGISILRLNDRKIEVASWYYA